MSIFRNKILIKFIATLCICLTLMNFGTPSKVYADWGGILINPVTMLLTSIADGIIGILHDTIQLQEVTLVRISGQPEWWEQWGQSSLHWLVTTVIILVAVGVVVATGFAAGTIFGGIVAALKSVAIIGVIEVVSITLTGTGVANCAGSFVAETLGEGWFPETIDMPAFTITPEHIFSNKIWLFDINFFNPMPPQQITNTTTTEEIGHYQTLLVQYVQGEAIVNVTSQEQVKTLIGTQESFAGVHEQNGQYYYAIMGLEEFYEKKGETAYSLQEIIDWINNTMTVDKDFIMPQLNSILDSIDTALTESGYLKIDRTLQQQTRVILTASEDGKGNRADITKLEIKTPIKTPARVQDDWIEITIRLERGKRMSVATHTTTVTLNSTASDLQDVVSKWYFILRNLALLILMLVLIYIGIRIAIGSTAGEKAKYKERLMDWLVAMCLLFVMQYIMIFALEIASRFTTLVDQVGEIDGTLEFVPLTDKQINYIEKNEGIETTKERGEYTAFKGMGTIVEENGTKYLAWTTDLLGKMKIKSQMTQEGTAVWVGYSLCYVVLVIETLFFCWTYIKRVLYMAFLTIIAPMVAMTYPIDKLHDGKAQAFDSWLKEYIFNLLIQPLHLLLYTVLVSVAYKLAATNPVYAIVAIGFIMPAENLLRGFFGFNKAKTPGALGGAAGAALAYTGLQQVMRFGNKGGKQGKDKSEKDNGNIKWANTNGVNAKETVAKGTLGKNSKSVATGKDETKVNVNRGKDGNLVSPTTEGSNGKDKGQIAPKVDSENGADKGLDAATAKAKSVAAGAQSTVKTTTVPVRPEKKEKAKTDSKKEGRKRSITRAAGATTMRYGRLMGQKIAKKINNTNFTKAAIRGVAGAYGATAMGMAGLALGVASGDPSKAFQYTTAGVAGGYSLGKGLGGAAVDAVSVDTNKIKDEMEMAYYGEDYKSVKFEESVQKMMHDEGNIDTIRKLTGNSYEEAQEVLSSVGRTCYESGITNMEDIAAVHQMEQAGNTREEAIAALKFNQYLPSDLSKMGENDREDQIKRWTREYEEAGYDDSARLAEESMRLAEKINKIKSDMKKA